MLPQVSGFWFVLELSSICTFILCLCHDTQSAKDSCSSLYRALALLLLLVFNQFDIRRGDFLAVDLEEPIMQVITDITLDGDLLNARRRAGHRGTRSKFLAQVLCDLLVLQSEDLQADHDRHVLALVPLDTFDLNLGSGLALAIACLAGGSFGLFLSGVFSGAFLCRDG